MRASKHLLATGLMLAAAVSGTALAGGKKRPKLSLSQLADYYRDRSGGLVTPVPNPPPAASSLTFTYDPDKHPYRMSTTTPTDYNLNQSLFNFDVQRFIQSQGAADLVDAHTSWYSRLDYDTTTQNYQQPYYYLDGWEQLFHPPVREVTLPKSVYFKGFSDEDPNLAPWAENHPFFEPDFQKKLDSLTGTQLTSGNVVQVLPNNTSFQAKLQLIRNTRHSLHIGVMFWACDESAGLLKDEIEKKIKAGVDVRLSTERFYREFLGRRCVDRLEQIGVKVLVVDDTFHSASSGAAYHQKIWIRDGGEEMILGGMNILDYENESTGFNHMNRDTDAHVVGPVAYDAEQSYYRLWKRYSHDPHVLQWADEGIADVQAIKNAQAAQGLRGQDRYADWLGHVDTRMNGLCRVNVQGSMYRVEPIGPIIEEHLRAAKKLSIFSTPDITFSLTDPANAGLMDSSIGRITKLLWNRKGPGDPQVRMLTNGEGGGAGEVSIWMQYRALEAQGMNNEFARRFMKQWRNVVSRRAAMANRQHSREVMGVNPNFQALTYMYYIHAKQFLFDRLVSVVGSWNLDHNSADLNSEVALTCMDQNMRLGLEHDMTLDLANSISMNSRNGQ
ncbi:MAG TPA: hypothetical protein VL588_03175 [Bdellovibrionota bacterium]|nr:hypothetical protein [Bdellovibrionota bacterium]